ncbi:MAG: glycoside hydrolase family 2 sugar binding protein, partial [Bacteroidetes bacterium]|nr:glycoside hydrolase family 2 sugar binding protein [Bacteroidota bacterium]
KALKNAFSPFGISLEIWDRHFLVGEFRTLRLFIFNDEHVPRTGTVRYGVVRFDDGWTFDTSMKVSVDRGESVVNFIQIMLPRRAGEYRIRAELLEGGGNTVVAYTEKIAHVFEPIGSVHSEQSNIAVCEGSGEINRFLSSHGFPVLEFSEASLGKAKVLIVVEGTLTSDVYQKHMETLSNFVNSGGTLVVIEPEFGVNDKGAVSPLQGLALTIERRVDMDKGGYDSYVFAEDLAHPLWSGIEKKHLQMFNGDFGGEVVSQHDVTCSREHQVHARCGLKLGVEAVYEIPFGKGRVIVSRLQLRGRLMRGNTPDTLYARRPDPVLQRYLLNLVGYASKR